MLLVISECANKSSRKVAPSVHFFKARKSPEHSHSVLEVPSQLPVEKDVWLWELGLECGQWGKQLGWGQR